MRFLESLRDTEQTDAYGVSMRNVSDKKWKKAESN